MDLSACCSLVTEPLWKGKEYKRRIITISALYAAQSTGRPEDKTNDVVQCNKGNGEKYYNNEPCKQRTKSLSA